MTNFYRSRIGEIGSTHERLRAELQFEMKSLHVLCRQVSRLDAQSDPETKHVDRQKTTQKWYFPTNRQGNQIVSENHNTTNVFNSQDSFKECSVIPEFASTEISPLANGPDVILPESRRNWKMLPTKFDNSESFRTLRRISGTSSLSLQFKLGQEADQDELETNSNADACHQINFTEENAAFLTSNEASIRGEEQLKEVLEELEASNLERRKEEIHPRGAVSEPLPLRSSLFAPLSPCLASEDDNHTCFSSTSPTSSSYSSMTYVNEARVVQILRAGPPKLVQSVQRQTSDISHDTTLFYFGAPSKDYRRYSRKRLMEMKQLVAGLDSDASDTTKTTLADQIRSQMLSISSQSDRSLSGVSGSSSVSTVPHPTQSYEHLSGTKSARIADWARRVER